MTFASALQRIMESFKDAMSGLVENLVESMESVTESVVDVVESVSEAVIYVGLPCKEQVSLSIGGRVNIDCYARKPG